MRNNKIAVYGSLRVGHYNYRGLSTMTDHLGTYALPGYKLYSLGPYPGIKEASPDDIIEVDVLALDDNLKNSIDRMEIGAGYSIKKVQIADHECDLYIYNGTVKEENLVKSGNWNEKLVTNEF